VGGAQTTPLGPLSSPALNRCASSYMSKCKLLFSHARSTCRLACSLLDQSLLGHHTFDVWRIAQVYVCPNAQIRCYSVMSGVAVHQVCVSGSKLPAHTYTHCRPIYAQHCWSIGSAVCVGKPVLSASVWCQQAGCFSKPMLLDLSARNCLHPAGMQHLYLVIGRASLPSSAPQSLIMPI